MDSSGDEGPVRTRVARSGRSKAPVKYFIESEEDSDDKENEKTKDWSLSGSDFEED